MRDNDKRSTALLRIGRKWNWFKSLWVLRVEQVWLHHWGELTLIQRAKTNADVFALLLYKTSKRAKMRLRFAWNLYLVRFEDI